MPHPIAQSKTRGDKECVKTDDSNLKGHRHAQKKKAKNERGNATKSNKTPGTAIAPSAMIPNKNKTWKRTATKTPTTLPTKNPPATPAGNDNPSTAASKKPRKKANGRKSGGKGRGKPTAKRN